MFYSQNRKNVTICTKLHLESSYKLKYPNFTFQEEILKYKLWDTLNLNINTSSEEGAKKVIV
jgi:hypothetical protein